MSGTSNPDGEMREEYEFTDDELRGAIRGKYAGHFRAGVAVVVLDPDVAEVFPDAESVNQALRAMASVIRARTAA